MEEMKHVIFKVGGQSYGLSILKVMGIERQMSIIGVPNRPSCIMGIINLRGNIIPVYDLKDRFELDDDDEDEDSSIIITSTNGITMAFKVDSVDEIIDIPESRM